MPVEVALIYEMGSKSSQFHDEMSFFITGKGVILHCRLDNFKILSLVLLMLQLPFFNDL